MKHIILILLLALIARSAPQPNCSKFDGGAMAVAYNVSGGMIAINPCIGEADCFASLCRFTDIGGVFMTIELVPAK